MRFKSDRAMRVTISIKAPDKTSTAVVLDASHGEVLDAINGGFKAAVSATPEWKMKERKPKAPKAEKPTAPAKKAKG